MKNIIELIEPDNSLIIFSNNKLKKDKKFLRFKDKKNTYNFENMF